MSDDREQKITDRIDREIAGNVALVSHTGGAITIAPTNMSELLEFSKLMSISGPCIRAAFRNNPGACLALALQAYKWGADPFAVANKAYVVMNKAGETQIAYEAQLIHAIVNTRVQLKQPLRPDYQGQGLQRSCKVTGWIAGRDRPDDYQSPPIAQIAVKNSPLWTADPDQQLFYYASRAWARRHVPEVLLGIYAPDEIAAGPIIEHGDEPPQDVPVRPSSSERRKAWREEGSSTEALRAHLAASQDPAASGPPPEGRSREPASSGESAATPESVPIPVPKFAGRRATNWEGYADQIIDAGCALKLVDELEAFRSTNARQFNTLRLADPEIWDRVQHRLADHERSLKGADNAQHTGADAG